MRSRNYTKEIGVTSAERQVPAALAFVILAIVAVAAVVFLREVLKDPDQPAVAVQPAPIKLGSR